MTSTIKVNNIQNQCGANIANKCGSTITLGASGDTITLACGATQTGFGRTGTVNWDTTAKTASFTAVSGNGYFVNTTSGAITATLPATPSAGDIVGFNDYARTFATNNLTIGRNGSNIQGVADDATISTNGRSTMFVYVDATQGWIPTEDQTTANYAFDPLYVTATGGTVTCCGDYKIHTFTGPGTFTVSCAGNACGSSTVDYLVIAGGGSGGHDAGGGGGAGGYRESSGAASGCYTTSPLGACVSALPVSVTGYPIVVGGGGSSFGGPGQANPGSNSSFSTITSTGGGGGAGQSTTGVPGGSGGGGARGGQSGGSGNTPAVSPPQGSNGGTGTSPVSGGGGGGATAVGGPGTDPQAGPGGAGATSSINGTPTGRGGGGGGGNDTPAAGGTASDGGGAGGRRDEPLTFPGTANTGGGGGGAGVGNCSGAGGSGIVIIRYKYQ
jgi:hypothetical protein